MKPDTTSPKLVEFGVYALLYVEHLAISMAYATIEKYVAAPSEVLKEFRNATSVANLTVGRAALAETLLTSKGKLELEAYSKILKRRMIEANEGSPSEMIQSLKSGTHETKEIFKQYAFAKFSIMQVYQNWFLPFIRAAGVIQSKTADRLKEKDLDLYYWELIKVVAAGDPAVKDFIRRQMLFVAGSSSEAMIFSYLAFGFPVNGESSLITKEVLSVANRYADEHLGKI